MPPLPETAPRGSTLGAVVVRVLAVAAGMAIGAMLASFAAVPGEPSLPSKKEALDLAVIVLPDHPFDTTWFNDTSAEDRGSREPADVGIDVPEALQFLIGDSTQEASTTVAWAAMDLSSGTATGYLNAAAGRLRADGWDVEEPNAHGVTARKDTLLVRFYADDYVPPSLDIVRVPPTWHRWAVLAGAVLGAAGAYLLARSVRRRETGEEAHTSTFLLLLGLTAVMPSFLVVLGAVAFELAWHPWIDTLLWRTGRFVPFGATLNLGLALLIVGWVWHVRRDRTIAPEPEYDLDVADETEPEAEDIEFDEEVRELTVEADPGPSPR